MSDKRNDGQNINNGQSPSHNDPVHDDTTPQMGADIHMDKMKKTGIVNPQMGRRTVILGAVATASAFSIKPAFAQAAGSVLNCKIPVPDKSKYISADGELVAPGTDGAFPPAPRHFTGEEVKKALGGRALPGTTFEQSKAYMNYIKRLRSGQSGFTCFASLQMPR